MQALILHDDARAARATGRRLAGRGFLVATTSDQDRAADFVRRQPVDLLILKEVIGTRHTTGVALAAELRNPRVATILLSARPRADSVETFELVPTLAAVLPPTPEPGWLAALALQAVQNPGGAMLLLTPEARVAAVA